MNVYVYFIYLKKNKNNSIIVKNLIIAINKTVFWIPGDYL